MPRIKYSKELVDTVKKLVEEGLDDADIANDLDIDKDKVQYIRAHRLGIKKVDRRVFTNDELQIIEDLNKMGFNDTEIGGIIGRGQCQIRNRRDRMGLPPIGKTCCSMLKRHSNDELKAKIITLINKGHTDDEIIQELDLQRESIRKLSNLRRVISCGSVTDKILSDYLKGEVLPDGE